LRNSKKGRCDGTEIAGVAGSAGHAEVKVMKTTELLDEYNRVLRRDGPDSDAAYDLLTHHIDETEFIHLAEVARMSYLQRRQLIRLLLLLGPPYIALLVTFLLLRSLG
jgi:hypothetical protein